MKSTYVSVTLCCASSDGTFYRFGGLGIRRLSSLALPVFLASATSTVVLQDKILGGYQPLSDSLAKLLKSCWVASYGPAPTGETASKQSTWDKPGILAESTAVDKTRTSPFKRACLLAARVPHSGD